MLVADGGGGDDGDGDHAMLWSSTSAERWCLSFHCSESVLSDWKEREEERKRAKDQRPVVAVALAGIPKPASSLDRHATVEWLKGIFIALRTY